MSDRVDLRHLQTGSKFCLITDDGRTKEYVIHAYHGVSDLVTVRNLACGTFSVMDASKVTAEPTDLGAI